MPEVVRWVSRPEMKLQFFTIVLAFRNSNLRFFDQNQVLEKLEIEPPEAELRDPRSLLLA